MTDIIEHYSVEVTDFVNEYGKSWEGTKLVTIRLNDVNGAFQDAPFRRVSNALVYAFPEVDEKTLTELIEIGAVYSRNNSNKMTFQRLKSDEDLMSIGILDGARTQKMKSSGKFRGFLSLRVHMDPKFFPRAREVRWAGRIVSRTGDRFPDGELLVLNKPAGVPCEPHMSNSADCVHAAAQKELGLPGGFCLNRLDNQTSGLVTVATSAAGAERFNKLLREKTANLVKKGRSDDTTEGEPAAKRAKQGTDEEEAVQKTYKVLTRAPVPEKLLGQRLVHFTPPSTYRGLTCPRFLANVEHDGWKRCELEVLSCEPVQVSVRETANEWDEVRNTDTSDKYLAYAKAALGDATTLYESRVRLLTGRTHQVRIQFGFGLGLPLVGDVVYEELTAHLTAEKKELKVSSAEETPAPAADAPSSSVGMLDTLNGPEEDKIIAIAKAMNETKRADDALLIGLQAAGLSAPELGFVNLEAPAPWWRGGLF